MKSATFQQPRVGARLLSISTASVWYLLERTAYGQFRIPGSSPVELNSNRICSPIRDELGVNKTTHGQLPRLPQPVPVCHVVMLCRAMGHYYEWVAAASERFKARTVRRITEFSELNVVRLGRNCTIISIIICSNSNLITEWRRQLQHVATTNNCWRMRPTRTSSAVHWQHV